MAVGATQTVEVTLQMQTRDGAKCGASRKVLAPVSSLKGMCCCRSIILDISPLLDYRPGVWNMHYSRKPAASLTVQNKHQQQV